jgi:hypothetical protein
MRRVKTSTAKSFLDGLWRHFNFEFHSSTRSLYQVPTAYDEFYVGRERRVLVALELFDLLYVAVWNSHPEFVSFCIGLLRDPALEPKIPAMASRWSYIPD